MTEPLLPDWLAVPLAVALGSAAVAFALILIGELAVRVRQALRHLRE